MTRSSSRNRHEYRQIAIAFVAALGLGGCIKTFLPPTRTTVWDPWVAEESAPEGVQRHDDKFTEGPADAGLADWMLAYYQRRLRRPGLFGPGCKFEPTCSVYARQVYAHYGAWIGTALTFDRLFVRESIAVSDDFAPIVLDSNPYFYDPPY